MTKLIKWNMKKMYDYCKENNLDLPKEGQEYTNLHNKYVYTCHKHGEYQQSWSDHKAGHGCKKCQYSTINKKDNKYFIDKLNKKFKGSIIVNKIYRKDKKVYGNFTCKKHNYNYDRIVNRMLDKRRGNLCPLCAKENKIKNRTGKTKKKTPEEYYNECKSKGYDMPIEDYINNSTRIKHKCNKGHVYEQTPNVHLHGFGCSICSGNKHKTFQEHYQECKSKNLDLPICSYKKNNIKVKYKCNKCGNVYEQTPNNHLYGYGCSVCNESHGEKFIRNYLDKNDIKYESQKRFQDLKDKTYLSYDFYLLNYNILIEYQGQQHYESISFNSKNKTDLNKQQYHDNLKREYDKNNGYKLLELKYTLNTQELVDRYLNRRIK